MTNKFTLYHYWRSSSSWRVRWALALKKIPCEFVAVDLLSDEINGPEQRARNPLGYVPVLQILEACPEPHDPASQRRDSIGKPKYLTESLAIIEWLDELFTIPSLLPGD